MRSWRGYKVALLKLLHLGDTPGRTAAAFAIGIFWGMSPVSPPFLGLQTGMALAFALVFRLNKLATVVGTLVSNPFTFVQIYTFGTYIGSLVLGYDIHINASAIRHFSIDEVFGDLSEFLRAFFVGNFISATAVSVTSYFVFKWFIARYRRLRDARRARLKLDSE
ncbi:DUF2062 domain-containing protein [bacterium]|nr:DUF2062 domain-containing protein [bacterium]